MLAGIGVPMDRLERLSRSSGVALAPPDTAGTDNSADNRFGVPATDSHQKVRVFMREILLLGSVSHTAMIDILQQSTARAWIEVGTLGDDALVNVIAHALQSDFYAFFTTQTANACQLACAITHALSQNRVLASQARGDIELALHEALANAMVHGNLQVGGMKGLSLASIDRFAHDLHNRFSDPAFALRRLEVRVRQEEPGLVVDVVDQGLGFSQPTQKKPTVPAASGRGLELISAVVQSYELLEGGRCIRMRFAP